jgi:hypothetical protein
MFLLHLALVLAQATNAQITTSMALINNNLGTDKIGFLGSVIGASNGHTTLAIGFDNGTDIDALHLGQINQTVTVSPNSFEYAQGLNRKDDPDRPELKGPDYIFHCDIASAPSNDPVSCTYSYGPRDAKRINCQASGGTSSTDYYTYTHTYPGRETYSAGVETIVRAYTFVPFTGTTASWCSIQGYYPESGDIRTVTVKRENVMTFQLVITAGMEKLSATQGAGLGASSATPTASAGAGDGSRGAAMPLRTAGPVLAGLGAAAAIFL